MDVPPLNKNYFVTLFGELAEEKEKGDRKTIVFSLLLPPVPPFHLLSHVMRVEGKED